MRARRLSALAVGTLASFGAVPYAAAPAMAATSTSTEPTTELILEAQPGDPVTGGFNGVITAAITAQGNQHTTSGSLPTDVYFTADMPVTPANPGGWQFQGWLESPPGVDLAAGQSYKYQYGVGPSYILTKGLGTCSGYTGGDIAIQQLAYSNGVLTQLEAVFTQYCGGVLEARGLIRYNATGPAPAGAPTGKPPAATAGSVAPMTFRRGTQIISATAGATDGAVVGTAGSRGDSYGGQTAWTPLGTRLFVTAGNGLSAVHPDGSAGTWVSQVNGGTYVGIDEEPAVSPDGSVLAFIRSGGASGGDSLMLVATDGADSANAYQVPLNGATCGEVHKPAFSPDGTLIYECDNSGAAPTIQHRVHGVSAQLIPNASQAVYSPDGAKIAFVRKDTAGIAQVFTVGADGVTGLAQVTQEKNGASKPAWSPDGKYLAYVNVGFQEIIEIPSAGGTPVGSIPNADDPDWTAPIIDSRVIRHAGGDRLATAVAASQANFAAHGDTADQQRSQAGAIVLARSDNFADALGGSSLAVRKDAPLLITPTGALDPAVLAEIQRVLAPGGTIYLLGGTSALSPAVANALSAYNVTRLSGDNRYATAVSIVKAISSQPKTVMVATGANYPDALAAGATGEPVLLTNGAAMPKETAAFLNTLNPDATQPTGTRIVTIGGPGDAALISGYQAQAMPSWPASVSRMKLAGGTRYETALLVAQAFFTSNTDVAIATGASWPDALSGGAMIGHRGGPLLLTDPAGLSQGLQQYLATQATSLYALHLLGGPSALPPLIAQQASAQIGLPGHVQSVG